MKNVIRRSLSNVGVKWDKTSVSVMETVVEMLPNGVSVPSSDCANSSQLQEILSAVETIEKRQVFHSVSHAFAIESSRCKHGFARAFVVRFLRFFFFCLTCNKIFCFFYAG
jgi:hypothetical protein